MNGFRRQSGMSLLGILGVLLMLGFFAMCIIRMTPPFLEYLSIKDIISRIATDPATANESASDIRRRIANIFNTNQIYLLDPKEVEVFNREGKTYIDANYEVRLPIGWRIDAMMKFDDLLYVVGNGSPVTLPPVTKR
jgi:hypothetical protein